MMKTIGSKNVERVLTFISEKTMQIPFTADAELDAIMSHTKKGEGVQREREKADDLILAILTALARPLVLPIVVREEKEMKITMFEIEASADDLRASRTVAESLIMALQRITDAFCGIGETNGEAEQEEDEVTE